MEQQKSVVGEAAKFAAKKTIWYYLKVPILIVVGVFVCIIAFSVLVFVFIFGDSSSTPEKGTGTWEVGVISSFGLKEIPKEYIPIYKAAGEKYNVPWNLLAAHHRVETRFSTIQPMISPVGAIGHMQFMPRTWVGWGYPGSRLGDANIPDSILTDPKMIKKYGGYGTDGNGDGRADPMNLDDAVHAAARYLAANGAADGNLRKAVFAYNHSEKYVNDVLGFADIYVKGFKAVEVGKPAVIKGIAWPVPGTMTVSSPFGNRTDPINGMIDFHSGLDIAGPGINGKPVVAIADGTVMTAGNMGALGNAVIIQHANGLSSSYGHMSAIKARIGMKVKAGDQIGNIGSTGRSTGPHLHLIVKLNGELVDPAKYLSKFKYKRI